MPLPEHGGEGEGAADARLAHKPNLPAHEMHQAFAYAQTDAGPSVGPGSGAVGLHERHEHAALGFGRYPNARIFDRHQQVDCVGRVRRRVDHLEVFPDPPSVNDVEAAQGVVGPTSAILNWGCIPPQYLAAVVAGALHLFRQMQRDKDVSFLCELRMSFFFIKKMRQSSRQYIGNKIMAPINRKTKTAAG